MKTRIGIIYGGPSGEHEVSVQSAENIRKALSREKYEVLCIGIDHDGRWHLMDGERSLVGASEGGVPRVGPDSGATVVAVVGEGGARLHDAATGQVAAELDAFFPITHGSFGEDGCLQGFLRLLGVPFVGSGVLGSAASMDKDVMKRLFRDARIPTPRFTIVRAADRDQASWDVTAKSLGEPLFVKPCNLGSSVGIHKVTDAEGFQAALDDAFQYDRKVIVEESVAGRELEVSVLGNDDPKASVVGEIVLKADFYSYQAKYVDEDGAALVIPADLDKDVSDRVRAMAVRAFQATECRGLARVDFFLREDGEVLVNELNTLPGFTRISMYPKLWEATGLKQADLMDRLIELALEEHAAETGLKRTYD